MKHYLKPSAEEIGLNRAIYDLSLTYAKEKLRFALEHDCVPDCSPNSEHPKYLDEIEYLANEFSTALVEYGDNSELLRSLDFTYEPDCE